jgi:hypothetical protein
MIRRVDQYIGRTTSDLADRGSDDVLAVRRECRIYSESDNKDVSINAYLKRDHARERLKVESLL